MPYLFVSFLAALLAIWAGTWSWADFIAEAPQKNITRWEKEGRIDSQKAFEKALDALQTARKLNPTNADYDLALGRLALLAKKSPALTQQASSLDPSAFFKLALANRPSSGIAWAYLAKSIAEDSSQSDLFIKAITRAAILEPYEKFNQKILIPLAIRYWRRLSVELQKRLMVIIQHGIRHQPYNDYFIVDAALRYKWADHLEPLLRTNGQKYRLKKGLKRVPTPTQ